MSQLQTKIQSIKSLVSKHQRNIKFINNYKNSLRDFINFFGQEFFRDNYRNDFFDNKKPEIFLTKFFKSKFSNKVTPKINNSTLLDLLTKEPRNL